jgi:hypothetical protein
MRHRAQEGIPDPSQHWPQTPASRQRGRVVTHFTGHHGRDPGLSGPLTVTSTRTAEKPGGAMAGT